MSEDKVAEQKKHIKRLLGSGHMTDEDKRRLIYELLNDPSLERSVVLEAAKEAGFSLKM